MTNKLIYTPLQCFNQLMLASVILRKYSNKFPAFRKIAKVTRAAACLIMMENKISHKLPAASNPAPASRARMDKPF